MYSELNYLNDFNNWLSENGLPLQLDHLPTKALKGNALKSCIDDKSYHGKVWVSATTWKHTRNDIEYPNITVIIKKHGESKHLYSGYNLLKGDNSTRPTQSYAPPPKRATTTNTDDTERKNAYKLEIANAIYDRAHDSIDHPYLIRKKVSTRKEVAQVDIAAINKMVSKDVHGTRWLIIPLTDQTGTVKAYQVINECGEKRFIGSPKGLYHLIEGTLNGRKTTPKLIYIAEGLATGLSIHAGNPERFVAVCLSTSNLEAATAAIKKRYPKTKLLFCADNDWRQNTAKPTIPHNVGFKFATLVAAKYRTAKLYLCPLVDGKKADFNDYAQAVGEVTDETLSFCEVPIVTPQSVQAEKRFNAFLNGLQHCVKYLSENDIKHYFSGCLKQWRASKEKVAAIAEIYPMLAHEWETAHAKERAKVDTRLTQIFKPSLPYAEHVHLNSPYLPEIDFKFGTTDSPAITLLKSPLGSGKTTQIKRFTDLCKQLDYRVVFIIPRRILARWVSRNLSLQDYQVVEIPREHDHLAIVINSIPLIGGDWRDVVIIDECEQVLKQITSKLIKDKKELITGFDSVLSKAKSIVLTDAHLGQITENYISSCMKRLGKTPRYIRYDNDFKRFSGRSLLTYDSYDDLLSFAIKCVHQGKTQFICTNGFSKTNELKKSLLRENPHLKILVINSDNSQLPETNHFIENIEQLAADYDVVIVSPSLTSGVSVNDASQHFDEVLGFFYSNDQTSGAQDAMQQINRVRYVQRVHVWYESKIYSDLTTDKGQLLGQMEALNQYLNLEYGEVGQPCKITYQHPYADLYADVKSVENSFLINGLESFIWLAERDGWEVVDGTGHDIEHAKEVRKESREAFKTEEVKGKVNAPILTDKEAFDLENSDAKTRDERHQLERYQIEQFYCEPISESLVTIDDNGKLREIVRLRETVQADDAELSIITKHQYEKACEQWIHPHLKPLTLTKQFYTVIKSVYQTDDEHGVNASSEDVQRAVQWIQQNETLLKAIGINSHIKSNDIMGFFGRHVRKLGYETVCQQITVGDSRQRFYTIADSELSTLIDETLSKRDEAGKNHIKQSVKSLKTINPELAAHLSSIHIKNTDEGVQKGVQADDVLNTVDVWTLPPDLEAAMAANFF